MAQRARAIACLIVGMAASASAQSPPADFLRGIAALHSFEYEEANEAFLRVQKAQPGFAMAYWGEAMTYHQTLWRNEDVAAARRALIRLGATPAARAAQTTIPKEQALLAAVDTLFGEGDADARRAAYAEAMRALYTRHPDDADIASFYALALLGTTSRSLIGYIDTHEGHSASLAGSDTQLRVADILGKVLLSHPEHPGALHYLLHNYDDPDHARLALPSARAYAKVAPQSSHALHMPAHIFVQLGMWEDAAASDRAAFAASDAWVKAKGLPAAMRSYHALSWLQYELLQLGRYNEAWETIGELTPSVKTSGNLTLLSDLSSMRARYVVEARRWDILANERNFGNVNELFAIGVSAARSGNAPLAELARQGLATRAQSEQEGDLRPALAIMEREVAALVERAAGRRELAIEILKAATQAELKLPPPLGLPAPIKPAPELLGEVLIEIGRPGEALEPFRQALGRNANRTLSVLGLARASAAVGQADAARQHYRDLLASYEQADAALPEINEARSALAQTGAPPSSRAAAIPLAAGIAALAAGALAIRQLVVRKRATPPTRPPRAARRRRDRARR